MVRNIFKEKFGKQAILVAVLVFTALFIFGATDLSRLFAVASGRGGGEHVIQFATPDEGIAGSQIAISVALIHPTVTAQESSIECFDDGRGCIFFSENDLEKGDYQTMYCDNGQLKMNKLGTSSGDSRNVVFTEEALPEEVVPLGTIGYLAKGGTEAVFVNIPKDLTLGEGYINLAGQCDRARIEQGSQNFLHNPIVIKSQENVIEEECLSSGGDWTGDSCICPGDMQLLNDRCEPITEDVSETLCTDSGGTWSENLCTCPADFGLEDGKCTLPPPCAPPIAWIVEDGVCVSKVASGCVPIIGEFLNLEACEDSLITCITEGCGDDFTCNAETGSCEAVTNPDNDVVASQGTTSGNLPVSNTLEGTSVEDLQQVKKPLGAGTAALISFIFGVVWYFVRKKRYL